VAQKKSISLELAKRELCAELQFAKVLIMCDAQESKEKKTLTDTSSYRLRHTNG
jgi:hypothetical protein